MKKVNAAWDFLKQNPWIGKCSTAAHTANRSPKPAPGDPPPDPDPLPDGFYRRGDSLFVLLLSPYMFLPPEEVLVCSGNFDDEADVVNSSDDNFYLITFQGARNKEMRLQILVDEPPKTIIRQLKRKGLKFGPDQRAAALLLEFIARRQPQRHLTSVTSRWNSRCYVTQTGTIGPPSAEEFVLDAAFNDVLVGLSPGPRQTVKRVVTVG